MRWIHVEGEDGPERAVLQVQPKHRKDLSLATNLLKRCLAHPSVSRHLQHAYRLFPDEPLIPVPRSTGDQLLIFLLTDYLMRVRHIARKGIKRAFLRTRSTRNGSPKGKIHVGASARQQRKRATVLPTVCGYDVHSADTAENRILKAALHQVGKHVAAHLPRAGFLRQLLAENAMSFEQVTLKSIEPNDRRQVRHSPFFSEYRPALDLAETILKWLGTSPGTDASGAPTRIPPFFIDMPELFERYCEVLLRERYSDVRAGYGRYDRSETAAGKRKLRPDFVLPSRTAILDSKYKYWIEQGASNTDYGQLALYGRHIPLLRQLGTETAEPELYLLYPSRTGHETIDLLEHTANTVSEFRSLYEYPVFVPDSLDSSDHRETIFTS
jgi:5-methylcytosine-specific restriction endonuclease McrBC regulatory subunit McrC